MTHHHSSSSSDRPTRAAPISALSAIGSAILPKSVTSPCLRASSPSMRSVIEATAKATNAAIRHPCVAVVVQQQDEEDRHEDQPEDGQGVGDVPDARLLRSRPSDLGDGHAVDATTVGDDLSRRRRRGARLADPRGARAPSSTPSTSGAWCAARPSPAHRSTDSTRTSTVSPSRSSARWATSSSASALTRSMRSRITASSSLPSSVGRLGAVLVGVAEDTDGVEPRRDQEPLELGQVVVGLAGEPDDDVGPHAGVGRGRADLGDQLEEPLGVAEPAHPPQHRPARVLEGQVEVRRDAGGRRHDLDQAGPHLGRLEIAHPHAVDARRPRRARAAGSRAGAGRRGPCRTTWSSRSPGRARARPARPASAPRSSTSAGRRDTNAPRNDGIAQNVQRRSQPEASLSGGDRAARRAAGAAPAGPRPGATPSGRSGRSRPVTGDGRPSDCRSTGASGSSLRRSRGTCGTCAVARQDRAQPLGDVGVVVEAQHRVGLGQRSASCSPYRSARQPTATTAWVRRCP